VIRRCRLDLIELVLDGPTHLEANDGIAGTAPPELGFEPLPWGVAPTSSPGDPSPPR